MPEVSGDTEIRQVAISPGLVYAYVAHDWLGEKYSRSGDFEGVWGCQEQSRLIQPFSQEFLDACHGLGLAFEEDTGPQLEHSCTRLRVCR